MKATVSKYVHYLAIGVVALLGVAAFCPLPAFAAEEGQGIGAILPHMDEFIPMLVAFIILWIILAKFGWPLFDGMLKKREDTIKNSLEKSERLARKANVCWQNIANSLKVLKPRLSKCSIMLVNPVMR